jgi:uncharacterized protein
MPSSLTNVPEPLRLSRVDARRLAVRAQLLACPEPVDMLDVVRRLTFVQLEPTSPIAPSADLVLWSRLGAAYRPQDLRDALDEQRLVELDSLARPAEDVALYRAEMEAWPGLGELQPWQLETRSWVEANNACRMDLLERLRGDGPLPASAIPDTCLVPWRSSGWNNHRNVLMLLTRLAHRGEVAVAGQAGREKLWDLAERVYPDDPVVPHDEALRERDRRRLRSLGIARAGRRVVPLEPVDVGEEGDVAVVEATKGTWRVDPTLLDQRFEARAALLSPFDRLVADRKRTTEIFGFDYALEMYKPAVKRRWGYYALPILYGDRLVGKLDARAHRDEGVLRVAAVHEDRPFDSAQHDAVRAEIDALAAWLGLEVDLPS